MSALGPELPPHLLAKRKRQAAGDDDIKEAATLPSASHDATSAESGEKRRRVVGPAAPPAVVDERPVESPDSSSDQEESDSDDDYGPALPSDARTERATDETIPHQDSELPAKQNGTKRDDWMMIPPAEDGLAARMDPTKARPRKFNTGKGARASNHGDGIDASWTETPEEKRKRLTDQVMGVGTLSESSATASNSKRKGRDEDTAARIRGHSEKTRGKSLFEEHRRKTGTDKDDDPSKRAFDREKDIGSVKIGHAQRKEMLNRAADFGSRFSGGGYL